MKDALGGSILFYIILGFIALFIVFIAIVLNYASAYRTNNYVVNMIEQYEGAYVFGNDGDSDSSTLVGYLRSHNYYNGLRVTCADNDKGAVFGVTTFIKFYLPIIELEMPIAINNDTKTLYGITCNSDRVQSIGCWSVNGYGEC